MIIMSIVMASKKRTALLRTTGRHMVRDARPRGAPHREADQKRSEKKPRIQRRPKAAVAKDASAVSPSALYRLMAWLSPAYPVGAFSYSSGIEWAVETGDIKDAKSLQAWLTAVLTEGGAFCDAIFFAHAYRAADSADEAALRAIAELASVFAPTKERHLETTAQGEAFMRATEAAWPAPALKKFRTVWDGAIAYPVAVGVAAAAHSIALAPALDAYLQAVTANLVSAGVRLIPLGQTGGQRVLSALEPVVVGAAQRALAASLDDVGSATFRADLASARHETQYTRLFRS